MRFTYHVSVSNLVILAAAMACVVDAYQTFSMRESSPFMTLSLGIFLTLWGLQEKPQTVQMAVCACALAGLSIASDRRALNENSTIYMVLFALAIVGFLYGIRRNRDGQS